jgi:hypothetical protein
LGQGFVQVDEKLLSGVSDLFAKLTLCVGDCPFVPQNSAAGVRDLTILWSSVISGG